MINKRLFEIKYIGPTNFKGSRIKITDTRFNKSVIIPYNYCHSDIIETARLYLASKDIYCVDTAYNEKSAVSYLLTLNFTNQIKE